MTSKSKHELQIIDDQSTIDNTKRYHDYKKK
jgi:hypothetical protein